MGSCLENAVADGEMTKKEVAKAVRLMTKQAFISKKNFIAGAMGKGASKKEAKKIFNAVGSNNDNKVDYKEAKAGVEWAVEHGELKKEDVPAAVDYLRQHATLTKKGLS